MITLYDCYDAQTYPHEPAFATFTDLDSARIAVSWEWPNDRHVEYDPPHGSVVIQVFCPVSGMPLGAVTKGWAYDNVDEWEKEMMT